MAPKCAIELAVATKVNDGRITSSSGFTPHTSKANRNPSVPFVTATAWFALVIWHIFFSNSSTHLPCELTHPELIQSNINSFALVSLKSGSCKVRGICESNVPVTILISLTTQSNIYIYKKFFENL